MKKLFSAISLTGFLALLSGAAHAVVPPPSVPEIDGGMAAIAIGLTVSVVALVREYRRKK